MFLNAEVMRTELSPSVSVPWLLASNSVPCITKFSRLSQDSASMQNKSAKRSLCQYCDGTTVITRILSNVLNVVLLNVVAPQLL